MKNLISLLFAAVCFSVVSFSQENKIKVYLLGTFHFEQMDTLLYDVNDEKHQKSIEKLSSIIIKLNPDKVFIEKMPEWEHKNRIDSLYQEYRKGSLRKRRNEIWQIGARVASALNHPHLYQCDQPGMYGLIYPKISGYAKAHNQQDILKGEVKGTTLPLTFRVNNDSLKKSSDLLEYLRWMNSGEVLRTAHAQVVNVFPQIGNTDVFRYDSTYFMGANLTIDWYKRNILIYSKILAQVDYTENSIFLVIGNDHIPVLKQLFRDNPYFEVVETLKWLGRSRIKPVGHR